MWTYRPANSASVQPEQRKNSRSEASVYRAAQSLRQPSAACFQNRDELAPHRAAVVTATDHTKAGPAPQPAGDPSGAARTTDWQRPSSFAKPSRGLRTGCVMGCLYLAGLAAGSLCSRVLSEPLLTYARYFASIDLGLRTTGNAAMVFSVGFLSLFCQLTLVLIAGFCVLGVGLVPITMLLKGAGAGVFTALLYQQLGPAKGLLLQALVFWLPETLGSLFSILLSVSALQVSCGLLRCCLGQSGGSLGAASRRLIRRYLTICFLSMLVCGLSVLLTLAFGGLF